MEFITRTLDLYFKLQFLFSASPRMRSFFAILFPVFFVRSAVERAAVDGEWAKHFYANWIMQNKQHMAQCPKFTLSRRTMKSDPPDGQLGLSIWINLNSISFGEFKCLSAFNIAFWRSVGWHFKFIPMGQQIFPFDLFSLFFGLEKSIKLLDWWNFLCVWWHKKRAAKTQILWARSQWSG